MIAANSPGTSDNVNTAFMSRTVNTDTVGQLDLLNLDAASGSAISNIQRCLNSYASFIGATTSLAFDDTPTWGSNELGTAADTLKARIEAIDAEFSDLTPYVLDATELVRGVVSISPQNFGGLKTFVNGATINSSATIGGTLNYLSSEDSTTTGANQTLSTPTSVILRLTNASLTSVDGITAPTVNQVLTIVNDTGGIITLNNALGAAANQIITGSAGDLELIDGASASLFYDLDGARWRVTGGAGDTSAGAFYEKYTVDYTDIQTAGLTNSVLVLNLEAQGIVESVAIKTSVAFVGASITDLDFEVGISGDKDKYMEAYDGLAAVADSNSDYAAHAVGPESFSGTTSINLTATAVGANLSALSAGSVDVWIKRSLLP